MVAPIIHILADGQIHSGGELATRLGISRSAVWKKVGKLRDLGLVLHAVPGKGYRVPGGIDLLDAGEIRRLLPVDVASSIGELDVFDEVDSTNTVAMSRARAGGGQYVCLAERQTAGRGRRGRFWASPFASNVYLSVVRDFQGGAVVTEGLSLAVGIAVCDAVRSLGVAGVMIKWPNDLVVEQRKIGGILIELSGDLSGACRAVIGIGLNVRMPGAAAVAIDQPWIDLHSLGVNACRNVVVSTLLASVLPSVRLFEDMALQPFRERWAAYDVCFGRQVAIVGAGATTTGMAMGIDRDGGLLLDTGEGVRVFKGGEVSLRGWA